MNPVFLWYPKLVGYFRIISTIIAFSCVFTSPIYSMCFYMLGQGLDAIDGIVARHFNQCSRFGALLDMLTDRMSGATLILVLALQYPGYWGIFAGIIVLDTVSHWCQMYAKLAQNATTHKGSSNPLLNFYYTFPYALLVFCVGNEVFFVCLYLVKYSTYPALVPFVSLVEWILYISFPISAGKQFMHVVQLLDAVGEVGQLDLKAHQSQGRPSTRTSSKK